MASTGKVVLWIGRSLLLLSAASLLSMPFTQHFWSWDRFLRGGQDFELAVSMVLTVLCLVVVLSKQCRRCMEWLFALWRLLAGHRNRHLPAPAFAQWAPARIRLQFAPPPTLPSVPLQI
jgi:hypothetical protein